MRSHRILLVALALVARFSAAALAEDFRIETKIFSGKEKTASSQNLTLFSAGYVYDYLSDPKRVAVFDRAHGRFILLDPAHKLKTEIKTEDVVVFSEKFHAWAAKSSNPFMKFAADPEFEVEFNDDGKLTLTSPHLVYRLETVPAKKSETAEQYREFCDWYARFNAMLNLGSTPPFPRLEVNKELFKRSLVPTEVTLTIPSQATSGVRAVTLRAEHHFNWRLLHSDQEKISETANQLATFKTVDLAEFEPSLFSKR